MDQKEKENERTRILSHDSEIPRACARHGTARRHRPNKSSWERSSRARLYGGRRHEQGIDSTKERDEDETETDTETATPNLLLFQHALQICSLFFFFSSAFFSLSPFLVRPSRV